MILFILQNLFLIVTATLGRQDVGHSLSEWSHHQWSRSSFQSIGRANSELTKQIQDIEDNLICYIYNICYANRNMQIPIVSQYTYDASDEALVGFINNVENVYGKRFTEPISEEDYTEKLMQGPFFHLKLKNFVYYLNDYYFNHTQEKEFESNDTRYTAEYFVFNDITYLNDKIYDTESLELSADLYGRYFANVTQIKEAEAKVEELFNLHKKKRRQEYRYNGTINESPEKRDEITADIKHICGLLFGYIFNSHSYHFREIWNKLDQYNKYGSIEKLRSLQYHLQENFENITELQLETQGENEFDLDDENKAIEWMLEKEIELRNRWIDKFALFKGSNYIPKDDEYTRRQLRSRIQYFAKFSSHAALAESARKLQKLNADLFYDSNSTSPFFNRRRTSSYSNANLDLSKKIQDIENNVICYIYNICHPNRMIQIPVVSQFIYDASDEALTKFINDVEEVYGKRFTETVSEEGYAEKLMQGTLFQEELKNFMDSLNVYFFSYNNQEGFILNDTIYDAESLKLTADLYGKYFANATQRKESEAKIKELFELHEKNRRQEDKSIFSLDFYSSWDVYESPEELDEITADIKHIFGLLFGYIFNSHSIHFREISNKLDQFNKYGAINQLRFFQHHLQTTFGEIINKQLKTQGRFYPEDKTIEWMLENELELRNRWNDKFALFKGSNYIPKDDEYTRRQLRSRIRYHAKFSSHDGLDESARKLQKLVDLSFPRHSKTVQGIVDLIPIGISEDSTVEKRATLPRNLGSQSHIRETIFENY